MFFIAQPPVREWDGEIVKSDRPVLVVNCDKCTAVYLQNDDWLNKTRIVFDAHDKLLLWFDAVGYQIGQFKDESEMAKYIMDRIADSIGKDCRLEVSEKGAVSIWKRYKE